MLGSGSSEYEHGQTDFRGNQHTTTATAPMTDRTRTVRGTPSRSTHKWQTNQLAASTIGLSRTTAAGSPKDQDADGAEHETDQKSDGRIERPSRGRDESEPLSGGSR